MKLCKAWPEACLTNSNSAKNESIVEPKSLDTITIEAKSDVKSDVKLSKDSINLYVDQVVSDVLKKAFGPEDLEDPKDPHFAKPGALTVEDGPKDVQMDNKPKNERPSLNEYNNMTTLWIAFGIFVLISILAYQSLISKLESMEAWLHGRLLSRP
jgi:hypothetical protein